MGAVDSDFTMKNETVTMLIPLHKTEGILLSPLTDTFKSPMLSLLWIDTSALIFLLMFKSVLWMGIGRLDGMLTRP